MVKAEFNHYTFSEQLKLPLIIRSYRPDIVHFPFFNVPILFFGKFVVTIHDMTMHRFSGGEATTRGFFKYLIWRLGYHMTFLKAVYSSTKIIVPSEFVKSDIATYYKIDKKKIAVTYEGVDDAIKATKRSGNVLKMHGIKDKYFVYSGSAYPHKNLKLAIKAVVELNQHRKRKVILAITSSRSVFTERVLNWAKESDALDYISHVGFVSDAELASLYTNSLAYLYPTKSEGFGLPGLEAMSVGAIVISSDIAVLREIYGKNAVFFNPNSVGDLVRTMNDVIEMDAEKRAQLIKKGLEFVKRYSWDKMAKETLDLYKKI
jgi:glycosyltransferase involved in cell wall biosynthesis